MKRKKQAKARGVQGVQNSNYFFAALAVAVLVIAAAFVYVFVFQAGRGVIATPTPAPTPIITPTPLGPPTAADILELSVYTDKQAYHANELMQVSVNITAAREIGHADIYLVGITNAYGRNYINDKLGLTLHSGRSQHNFSYLLPTCSSCSGLAYGSHSFNVSVLYNGTALKTVAKTIEIVPTP